MKDEERIAWETMQALRQARDAHLPGSNDFKSLDEKYKKAEAEYFFVSTKGRFI
jgi:hypothetical protein